MHLKRLELLSELVPHAGVIALLVNPKFPGAERQTRDVQEAARAKRVQLPMDAHLKLRFAGDSPVEEAGFRTIGPA